MSSDVTNDFISSTSDALTSASVEGEDDERCYESNSEFYQSIDDSSNELNIVSSNVLDDVEHSISKDLSCTVLEEEEGNKSNESDESAILISNDFNIDRNIGMESGTYDESFQCDDENENNVCNHVIADSNKFSEKCAQICNPCVPNNSTNDASTCRVTGFEFSQSAKCVAADSQDEVENSVNCDENNLDDDSSEMVDCGSSLSSLLCQESLNESRSADENDIRSDADVLLDNEVVASSVSGESQSLDGEVMCASKCSEGDATDDKCVLASSVDDSQDMEQEPAFSETVDSVDQSGICDGYSTDNSLHIVLEESSSSGLDISEENVTEVSPMQITGKVDELKCCENSSSVPVASTVDGSETSQFLDDQLNGKSDRETFDDSLKYFNFKLSSSQVVQKKNSKSFQCDICGATYRHIFTLKRHYLKFHINMKYISEEDLQRCSLNRTEVNNNSNRENKNEASLTSSGVNNVSEATEAGTEDDANSNGSTTYSIKASDGKELFIVLNVVKTGSVKEPGTLPSTSEKSTAKMIGLYSCNFCNRTFDEASELREHLANHANYQGQLGVFKCEHCDMTFNYKRNLGRHSITHTGQKILRKKSIIEVDSTASQDQMFVGDKLKMNSSGESAFSPRSMDPNSEQSCEMQMNSNCEVQMSAEEDKKEALEAGASVGNRYACTVCKKPFANYINMCRHRRLAHHVSQRLNGRIRSFSTPLFHMNQNRSNKTALALRRLQNDDQTDNLDSDFYLNLSESIKENLAYYIDGMEVNVNRNSDNDTDEPPFETSDIQWLDYNFSRYPNLAFVVYDDQNSAECNDDFVIMHDFVDSCQLPCGDVPLHESKGEGTASLDSYQKMIDYSRALLKKSIDLNPSRNVDKLAINEQSSKLLSLNLKPSVNVNAKNPEVAAEIISVPEEQSKFVCNVCRNIFNDYDTLMEHNDSVHPMVLCSYVELIDIDDCPPELRSSYKDSDGMLTCYESLPANSYKASPLFCTKCSSSLQSVEELHLHILECGTDKSHLTLPKAYRRRKYRKRRKGMKRKFSDDEDEVLSLKSCDKEFMKTRSGLKYNLAYRSLRSKVDIPVPESPEKVDSEKQEYRCEGCYMKFDYTAALERHQRACTMARRLNGIKSNARGLYSRQNVVQKKRQCQHCLQSFDYLASLRKHMEDGCIQQDLSAFHKKIKRQKKKVPEQSVRGQIEESMSDLFRNQSKQNKLLKCEKKDDDGMKNLRTFSCKICHKKYFSYVNLLKHSLSHKLEKCNDVDSADKTCNPEVANESTPQPKKRKMKLAETGEHVVLPGYTVEECTCTKCGKILASPLNMGRHDRIAHGIVRQVLNRRRMLVAQMTDEEKALSRTLRVVLSKKSSGNEGMKFEIQNKVPKHRKTEHSYAKEPKIKKQRKSNNKEISDVGQAEPKKRSWPKGRKRKGWVSNEEHQANVSGRMVKERPIENESQLIDLPSAEGVVDETGECGVIQAPSEESMQM